MRLGQLARKLSVRTNEIVTFMASQNIQIDSDSNSRIDDLHLPLIMRHFNAGYPGNVQSSSHEDRPEIVSLPTAEANLPALPDEMSVENSPSSEEDQTPAGDNFSFPVEVIKAPKLSLPGLTVLGKIELQQPKKAESEPEVESQNAPTGDENQKPEKMSARRRDDRRRENKPRGSGKNPIAAQRERRAREEERRREEEKEKEKERRMSHYMKKVKPFVPTKPARIHQEETEELPPAHEHRSQSVLAKFMRWLRREK